MLLLDLIRSIPARIYNALLAILMSSCMIFLYLNSDELVIGYEVDKRVAENYVLLGGVVIFFFFSRFESIFGQFLKALAYVLIGAFVVYATSDIQDETVLLMIRSIVGLVVAFGLYAFISSALNENKEDDLMKNGWKLETKVEEIIVHPGEEGNWYAIKTVGRSPSSGEELVFMSDDFIYNPDNKLSGDEKFIVYVDKNNPKRYFFDEKDLKFLYRLI